MVGGAVGLFFFVKAIVHAPPVWEEKEEPAAQSGPASPGEHKGGGEKAPEHTEKKSSEKPKEEAKEATH
jgi:hypothetical protein